MIGIYKITSPSKRIYIGQSINIEKRKISYKNLTNNVKCQIKLYNSIKKYGWDNHKFEVIEECNRNNLNIKERYWQDYYDVLNENGLNCILQSTDKLKHVVSKEVRKKISNANKGKSKKFSETHLKNLSESHKGHKMSQQTKDKIGEANKYKEGKKLYDNVTHKYYKSLGEAALDLNMKYGTLRAMLNGQNKNKTNLIEL